MKILVTGGCGFIGSNFIRYILAKHKNCKVINLDKLSYAGNPANLKDIAKNTRYKFIRGDICNKKLVHSLLSNSLFAKRPPPSLGTGYPLNAIVNFAAQTHVDRSIKDSYPFVRSNVEGLRVLLEAARKFNIKRFMQISTDEVYGDIKRGYSKEPDPLLPNSPYAASKAAADLLCGAYYRTYRVPVVITRSSNNLGPYQYPEKVTPLFITNLMEGKRLPLYGDGRNVRDWIYVEDNCRAIDLALRKGRPGEIYNVGGGNQVRNIELAKAVLKEFKLGQTMLQHVADRPGHDRRYALSSNKIKALGFRPRYTFKQALKATVNWYRENGWWWKPLKKKAYIIKW